MMSKTRIKPFVTICDVKCPQCDKKGAIYAYDAPLYNSVFYYFLCSSCGKHTGFYESVEAVSKEIEIEYNLREHRKNESRKKIAMILNKAVPRNNNQKMKKAVNLAKYAD